MMERPRSLPRWGVGPGRPGPTWRAAVSFVVVVALLSLLLEGWWILRVPALLRNSARVVELPAHKGVTEVAEILDEAGVIRSRVGFVLLALARGSFRSLKAGEYQIPKGANTVAVLAMLAGGRWSIFIQYAAHRKPFAFFRRSENAEILLYPRVVQPDFLRRIDQGDLSAIQNRDVIGDVENKGWVLLNQQDR